MHLAMDQSALTAFFAREFAQISDDYAVDLVAGDRVVLRLRTRQAHLRPGGTISGPSMFALADLAIYAAILSRIGPVALAVTTSASIDFMRKPAPGRDLLGEGRLLKLGRQLAVGDVLMRTDGCDDIVARASMTYAIPPDR